MSDLSLPSRLRQLSYFAHISELHLSALAQQAVHRTFAPDESIFIEGDESAGLWIVESGRVKAYKLSPDGQEYILRFFGPGDTFNDLSAFDGAPNAANATAVTAVSAWVIQTAVFAATLQADHKFCLAVLQGLVGRVRELVGRVEDLALRPVTARLAHFLLEQVEDPTWPTRLLPALSSPATWPLPLNLLAAPCACSKRPALFTLTVTAQASAGGV